MTLATFVQPLPQLVWDDAGGYSDFPSLAIARYAHDLAAFGTEVRAIYARSRADLAATDLLDADYVVVGDLRFYTYFANPAPLVRDTVFALLQSGIPGRIVVTGRHAHWMADLGSIDGVSLAPAHSDVMRILAGHRWTTPVPEHDPLPPAGVPDLDLLIDGADLPGSFSRPGPRISQLLLTKGCPFSCAFCEKARSEGGTLTPGELEEVLAGFETRGIERVIFWDEVFGPALERDPQLFGVLRASPLRFNCNTRCDLLDPAFVERLADAGCDELLFGIEVAPEEERAAQQLGLDRGKRPGRDALEKAVSLLRSSGIAPVGSMIVGLPHDTPDTIQGRIEIVDDLDLSHTYIRPLVPFPETAIYRQQTKRGTLDSFDSWGEGLSSFPHGYPTLGKVSRADLQRACGR